MKRGNIYYADLNPTVGSEIQKIRPVLIVSNNANNKMSSTITVIPITSNVKKIYPFEVFLDTKDSGLQKESKAQCHQIRTISKLRLQGKQAGNITSFVMSKIEAALMLHLDL
jgi:mRNA interferase MazF